MRYVINRADGGVSLGNVPNGVDLNNFLAKWSQSAKDEWLPATIEEFTGTVPSDRSNRFAWRKQGNNIAEDASVIAAENAQAIAAKRVFDSIAPNANDAQIRTAINRILKWIRDNNFPEDPVAPK